MPATNRGPWAGQSSTTGTGTGEGESSTGATGAGPGTGEPGPGETGSTGAEGNGEATGGQGQGDGAGDAEAQSRREADLRQRVKAAEEASTADRALVEQLQTAEANRLAGAHLANAGDLWDVGKVSLADVLAEDGSVDADKVKAASEKLIAERGRHFAYVKPNVQTGAGGNTNSRFGRDFSAQTGGQRLSETSRAQGVGKRPVENTGTKNPGTHRLTG